MASLADGKGVNKYGDVENIHLTQENWSFRWTQNQHGFHSAAVNPHLHKYENMLLEENCRVFVPLCGKSVDLMYLANKGHDVFGCEFVEKAVKDFFAEQSLDYTCEVKNLPSGQIQEFKATSKRITIWQCDFFILSSAAIGKFDAVWDRASLEAIDPLKRRDYVQIMLDLLRENGKYLLNASLMTGVEYSGPPYSVSLEETEQLYGNFFDITLLETCDEKFAKVASRHRYINFLQLKT